MLKIKFTNTNVGKQKYGLTTDIIFNKLYEALGDDLHSALLCDEENEEITLLVGENKESLPTINICAELVEDDAITINGGNKLKFKVGDRVQIRTVNKEVGTVIQIDDKDDWLTYLVQFDSGDKIWFGKNALKLHKEDK